MHVCSGWGSSGRGHVLHAVRVVQALSKELVSNLETTDEAFKPSLTEHICTLLQKYSPSTRWFVDQLLKVMVTAGEHVQVPFRALPSPSVPFRALPSPLSPSQCAFQHQCAL